MKQLGCKKVFCVFDQGIKSAGIAAKIIDNLVAAGLQVVIFDGVKEDPPDTIINEAAEIALAEQIDGIVGVGGGSTMDTAKGINVLMSHPGPIGLYYGPGKAVNPGIAGIAFNDALPQWGHAIAHTLGSHYHIPHGIGCALALPAAVEYVADVYPEKLKQIGLAMGMKLPENLAPAEMGAAVAEAIREFNRKVGIPGLKELKVKEASLQQLPGIVLADDCAAHRLSVGGKSPLTGGIKEANSGGTAATYLAKHDIKMIVLEDQPSDNWYLLKIAADGTPELLPAADCAGLNNYALVEKLKERYGEAISVISIGTAGEKQYPSSTLQIIDAATGYPSRAAARGGLGAVMGAKKVKAVVIEKSASAHGSTMKGCAGCVRLARRQSLTLLVPQQFCRTATSVEDSMTK